MTNTMFNKQGDPHAYITFEDILALSLAHTKTQRYYADSEKWQQVLYVILEKYKDKMPELRGMFFDESRSDLPHRSEQFYQLINILSASKLISLPNPAFEFIVMDFTQKERVKKLEEYLLEHYQEYIADIADMLEKELAVN